MNGFFCVIKPPGMTSSQVVSSVKRLLTGEKIGHGGTLDPQAAGILPIMVGKATKLFDYLVDKEKEYVAEVAFGQATDTQDAQGTVLTRGDQYPSAEAIIHALPTFVGIIDQVPPAYSAIKVQGQRAYHLARDGQEVVIPSRKVEVYDIAFQGETPNHGAMLRIRCGKGTYVRTLCYDLGEALGCPAHMRFLLRTKSGAFTLDRGYTLEELQAAKAEGNLERLLMAMDEPITHYKALETPAHLAKACWNGGRMPREDFPDGERMEDHEVFRLYLEGRFMGMAAFRGDNIVLQTMVAEL